MRRYRQNLFPWAAVMRGEVPESIQSRTVYDRDSGKCVGWMFANRRASPLDRDLQFVRKFLVDLNKTKQNQEGVEMDNGHGYVNEVKIVGQIKKLVVRQDSVFMLIDTGLDKWIPATAHAKEGKAGSGLISDLAKFEEGDTVTLKGYVRPWSVQKDGTWVNSIDVRIIALKPGTIPARKAKVDGGRAGSPLPLPEGW